jgi:probable selenium-dependent hydroxylase accessory protein YqeC
VNADANVPLLDLLQARTGIVCAVGAGGKKTTLQRLFTAHPGRAALTATVYTAEFRAEPGVEHVLAEPPELPGRVAGLASRHVAYASPSDKPDRHAGVVPTLIERIHIECAFEATYVKADGARMRWIKAPAEREPVVPHTCRTVIAIVSARALGEPLTGRIAHRLEVLTTVTGARPQEKLAPVHLARLLTSPRGLLKGCDDRRVVPVINMVDDEQRTEAATETARRALDLTDRFDYVVLACMRRPDDPVVAVIRR